MRALLYPNTEDKRPETEFNLTEWESVLWQINYE